MLLIFITCRTIILTNPSDLCENFSWTYQAMAAYSFIILTVSFITLIVFLSYFMCKMQKIHNFEFNLHRTKYLLITGCFLLLLACELFIQIFYFNFGMNSSTGLKFMKDNLWQVIIFSTAIEILPYLIFLIVTTYYQPHDCFRCFGKDPDRKFSTYQFTLEQIK